MKPTPLLTIALVVRNEEWRLPKCLEHLLCQDILKELHANDFEFLIVDNQSSDRTVEVATSLLQNSEIDFKIFYSGENNMGLARGLAVRQSRARYVAFVDADCWVPKNWLRRLLEEFQLATAERPRLAAVASGNVPGQEHRWGQTLFSLTQTFLGHLNSNQAKCDSRDRDADHVSTCAVLYRRDAVLQVGNFSSEQSRVCEDVDLSCRLIQSGFQLRMVSGIDVQHHHSPFWKDWFKKILLYGSGQPKMLLQYPSYRHRRFLLPLIFPWLWLSALLVGVLFTWWPFVLGMALYLSALTIVAATGSRTLRVPVTQVVWALFLTHWAYALGMLMGWGRILFRFNSFTPETAR